MALILWLIENVYSRRLLCADGGRSVPSIDCHCVSIALTQEAIMNRLWEHFLRIKPGDMMSKSQWGQAGESAQAAAGSTVEMAGHAALGVSELAGQAMGGVGKKVDELAENAGIGIQNLGDRLHENTPNTGPLGYASRAVVGGVKGGGEYIEEAKLSGMAEDLSSLIRKHPIPSILIGIGVGWFLGRKLKS